MNQNKILIEQLFRSMSDKVLYPPGFAVNSESASGIRKVKKFIETLIAVSTFILLSPYVFAGQFRVTWVYDGDTFRAEGHDIEIVVRFLAIDAPEISFNKGEPGQPFGDQSKKMLIDLILHETVELEGYGIDTHNRVLAVVWSGGKNIGVEMIRNGLAEVYQGKLPDNFNPKDYKQAEFHAKTARRGMWTQGNNYISPRKWRERQWRR